MFKLTKEQLGLDEERDQNMSKLMPQLDIFSILFIGASARSFNNPSVGCVNLYETKFEDLYIEEVNLLANKGGIYHSNYLR